METTGGESLAACRAGLCWAGGDSSHRTVLYCTVLYCTVHLHPSLQPNIDLVSAGAGPLVWLVLEPGVTTALSTIHRATKPGKQSPQGFLLFSPPLHFIEMSVSCGRDTGGARGSPAPVEATADTLQQEGDLAAVFLFRRILFGCTCCVHGAHLV